MKKDKILKELLKEIAIDISKHLLKIEIDEDIEIIDKEMLKIEKREADLIFKSGKKIIQIEIQNNYHPKMHLRMLRYFSDLAYSFENYEIEQFVIYIGKEKSRFKTSYNNKQCKFEYNFIDMRNINCKLFLNSNKIEEVILAILCDFKNENPQNIINEILIKLNKLSKDDYEFKKNVEILEILSTNRELEEFVKKGVEMLSQIKLEELPTFKEGLNKGLQEGLNIGLQEGLNKGILKGKILAYLELGVDINTISKKLNLSKAQIENLIKD